MAGHRGSGAFCAAPDTNLRPEVTDSFELAWQRRDGGTFYSATAFYRDSRGGVTDVVTDLGGGVLLSTRANLATTRRTGVELLANGKLSKTLSYNASATLPVEQDRPARCRHFDAGAGAAQ